MIAHTFNLQLLTETELRYFIEACHRAHDYGALFEELTNIYNTKYR
jgi:hypothetical protein